MLGSFIIRGLVLVFGYLYPAYECYKVLERNNPNTEDLLFWCRYWTLMAVMQAVEKAVDTFISWTPMYGEAKLAFIIYLWHHKTKGTTFVYDSFFKPYVAKHETQIDRNLLELKTRAGDIAAMYCQKAAIYGQTKVFEILQYIAAQSTSRSPPTQAQSPDPRAHQPPVAPTRPSTTRTQPQIEEPPSPSSSMSSSQLKKEVEQEARLSQTLATTTPLKVSRPQIEEPLSPISSKPSSQLKKEVEQGVSSSQALATTPLKVATHNVQKSMMLKPIAESSNTTIVEKAVTVPVPESPSQSVTSEIEAMQTAPVPLNADKEMHQHVVEDTIMEETIHVTHGRLRKTWSAMATK